MADPSLDPPLDAGGGSEDSELCEEQISTNTEVGDQDSSSPTDQEASVDNQATDDQASKNEPSNEVDTVGEEGRLGTGQPQQEEDEAQQEDAKEGMETERAASPRVSADDDKDHCDTETLTQSHVASEAEKDPHLQSLSSQQLADEEQGKVTSASINVVVTDSDGSSEKTDITTTEHPPDLSVSGNNRVITDQTSGSESLNRKTEIEPELSSVDLSGEEAEAIKLEDTHDLHSDQSLCVDDPNVRLSGHHSSNSASASNSERSSMTASPAFGAVSVQAESAENRETLANMAGDIQSVIDRSFAMLETDTLCGTDSASDTGPCTPPSELSSEGVQATGSLTSTSTSNNTSSHSTPLHNRAVLDIQCDSQSREQSPSHFKGLVSADASVVQLGQEDVISVVAASGTFDANAGKSGIGVMQANGTSSENSVIDENDRLLSELESELDSPDDGDTISVITLPNGIHQTVNLANIPEHKELRRKYEALQRQLQEKQSHLHRLAEENKSISSKLSEAVKDRDAYHEKLEAQRDQTVEDLYLIQVKELEHTIAKQNRDLQQSRERLTSHDQAAKRAIGTLQSELQSKVDQVTKMYKEAQKEKENMVMTYASAEQKNIKLQSEMAKVENRMKEMSREREIFMNRFRNLKMEKQKMSEVFDSKGAEMAGLRRELERYRESLSTLDGKLKWTQNKLKTEQDTHKECRTKFEESSKKIKQAREETEQIRKDCQAIIKQYQTSEEIKSNSLDSKLKEKEVELLQEKQEKTDQEEVYLMVIRELETLKKRHKELLDEDKLYKDKIQCLEAERMVHEETMKKFKETLQKQKKDNQDMYNRLQELDQVDQRLNLQMERADTLQAKVEELEEEARDMAVDMQRYTTRESEHLDFTQKISDKNARLQSENTTLSKELTSVTSERQTLTTSCASLEKKVRKLESELTEEKRARKEIEESLTTKLQSKVKEVGELAVMLDDERNENKTLKRKNVANIKDLTRQLQQARKKLDSLDHTERDSTSLGSMGSRTSSNNSLDTIAAQQQQLQNQQHHLLQHGNTTVARLPNQNNPPQEEDPPFVEVVEVDKQMLMDKIVRLQKAHARKNEKMEFMEDHINQLNAEVKKKAKLIQHYVMIMDAGTVTPESHDYNKPRSRKDTQAQLVRKGGIMASLYSHHQQDGAMNLELSLEINHKIQAVLEDTLLKNITLKENLDTLGQEIARLSQENRRLQLILQGDRS